jgi:hypothetical protein
MKWILAATLFLAAACTADPPVASNTMPDAMPGAPDAAPACVLPTTTVSCTVGNDAPCHADCADSFCYNFQQLPNPVCTSMCPNGASDCPSGWSCNNMGRCRPPG